MIGIYEIFNKVNSKRYIGSSVQIEIRLAKHIRELNRNKHENSYLQRSFNKYGIDYFQFKPLIECLKEDLHFYEDLIISSYKSNRSEFGFNLREVCFSNSKMKVFSKHTGISGTIYNYLTLVQETQTRKQGKIYWLCKCKCGNEKELPISYVRSGHTKSCGCLQKEKAREVGKLNRKYN